MTITPFIRGFSLSASLIIAIGAQNAFVLRQGLRRNFVFATAIICSLADALLISLGVGGMGVLVTRIPAIANFVTWGGVIFLLIYGGMAFRSALFKSNLNLNNEIGQKKSLRVTILTALGFSFLNPHVYLDTVVLIGSLGAQYLACERIIFIIGAISASFTWFFGLSYGAVRLASLFQKPVAWRVLDTLVGIVMWWIALVLVIGILG
ncbi:MAG: amino acid transporter [Chloroflexi bacterium]|nr:amino acid transporter [Chloroflexota bacterium]